MKITKVLFPIEGTVPGMLAGVIVSALVIDIKPALISFVSVTIGFMVTHFCFEFIQRKKQEKLIPTARAVKNKY